MSAKKEVPESEAEQASESLYEFVKSEVIKSVNAFNREIKAAKSQPKLTRRDYAINEKKVSEQQKEFILKTDILEEEKFKKEEIGKRS